MLPTTAPALPADELRAWLRLVHSPGLGPSAARRLLAAFGSPQHAVAAGPTAWREVGGGAAAQALIQPALDHEALFATTLAWLEADPDRRHLLTLGDPAYPSALLEIADPPLLLYAQGRLSLLAPPSLAIVGSRHATTGGLDNARAFARHLSASGLVIVSGLALGIDGAAHDGALAGAEASGQGGTIAVVGTGLDRVYPKRHHALAHRMIDGAGLILSGLSPDGRLVEIIELPDHPFFVGSQFHPEFKSRPNRPHPLFRDFIAAAKEVIHEGDQPTLPLTDELDGAVSGYDQETPEREQVMV